MSDFTSSAWSLYIMVATAAGLIGCLWLINALSRGHRAGPRGETTGHRWDETLEEYNNPMPRWWVYLFYLTIVFAIVYLALYPGFGSNRGTFGWTSVGQYEAELARANAATEPLFAKYKAMPVAQVAADPQARAMGERMFLTYCVQCHGSNAQGSKGFPNLTDRDWLYGGEPETIETTILDGRNGMMPPMGAALGGAADVEQVAHYVLSLSGSAHDAAKAELGKPKFAACAACHGPDGKGNPALGSANLTDRIWLFGGSLTSVTETINNGRSGHMPAFRGMLGEGKVHVLAAYVWSLSNMSEAAASR